MTNFQGQLKVMLNLAKSLKSNELFLMFQEFFIAENSQRTGNLSLDRTLTFRYDILMQTVNILSELILFVMVIPVNNSLSVSARCFRLPDY
jgi:hypothetical protein